MQLFDVLLGNAGKDIYICLEFSDGKRENIIIKKYNVLKEGTYFCLKSKESSNVINFSQEVQMTQRDAGFIMTKIKAKYGETKYYMYITDNIGDEVIMLSI